MVFSNGFSLTKRLTTLILEPDLTHFSQENETLPAVVQHQVRNRLNDSKKFKDANNCRLDLIQADALLPHKYSNYVQYYYYTV
jgi:hypothetical protein